LKDSFDEGGKAILFDMNFLNKLKGFEKDGINEETIELLSPYMGQEWFTEDKAGGASKAAAGLLKWTKAIYEYHEKSKIVKPKKVYLQI
jgi:dynein heavy chain